MGCFNSTGFFTHQPIYCGMDCVGFFCIRFNGVSQINEYKDSNGKVISPAFTYKQEYSIPISLPIFGTYNDYGGITNIQRSPIVDDIEEYFGYDIECAISDCIEMFSECGGRYKQVKKIREDIINGSKTYDTLENYFMKTEFERFDKVYQKLINTICINDDTVEEQQIVKDRINEILAIESPSEEEMHELTLLLARRAQFNYIQDKKYEDFEVFFCIDHKSLWDSLCTKPTHFYMYGEDTFEKRIKYLYKGIGCTWNDQLEDEKIFSFCCHNKDNAELIDILNEMYYFYYHTRQLHLVFREHGYAGQDTECNAWEKFNNAMMAIYKKYGEE